MIMNCSVLLGHNMLE